ncbi:MAG: phosphatase PAP2 family protein [Neisseriaceae bacterium]|nr:phosphatase PAP2 family protein [Neisseriaceae bacterium]MBP6861691.1 phosphatase PAP2 family protein [Neisseriaceae bacterium]
MSVGFRVWALLSAWGFVGLCYTLGAAWADDAVVLYQTWLDDAVPFWADGMVLYLSFFALVPYAFLYCDEAWVRPLRRSMQYAAVAALAVYLIWPSSMVYPVVAGDGLNERLWLWLHAWDTAANCLPSLHVVLAVLCGIALGRSLHGWRRMWVLLWVVLVMVSVLLLKRHLWIDVCSGVVLALLAAKWGGLCGRRTLT